MFQDQGFLKIYSGGQLLFDGYIGPKALDIEREIKRK